MRRLTWLLILSIALQGSPAFAQEGDEEASALDARIAELLEAREEIDTEGPRRLAVWGGAGAIAFGILVGTVALACKEANSNDDTRCRENRADKMKLGFGIAAGVSAALGLVGVFQGAARADEVEVIDDELDRLKRERSSLLSRLGAAEIDGAIDPGGQGGMLSFRWTF